MENYCFCWLKPVMCVLVVSSRSICCPCHNTKCIFVSVLQDLDLPLNASSWTEEDLKDPKKLYEMTILLNAQREIADKILDTQWETKWREEKVSKFLKGFSPS